MGVYTFAVQLCFVAPRRAHRSLLRSSRVPLFIAPPGLEARARAMKSRSNSPQTSPQIRKYRVDSRESATVPSALRKASFRVEELPPINMNTSFQGSSPAPERESYHKPGLLGPVPAGVRRVSGESTPSRPILNGN